jgi:hypothetical protein
MLDLRTDPACTHPRMNLVLKPISDGDVVIPCYDSIPARA